MTIGGRVLANVFSTRDEVRLRIALALLRLVMNDKPST